MTVQNVLRHSRTAMTTDVYMLQLPEGVRETVNSIHLELTQKSNGNSDGGPRTPQPTGRNTKILSFNTRKPIRFAAVGEGRSEAVFADR